MESLLTGKAILKVEHRSCVRRGIRYGREIKKEIEEAQLARENRSKNKRGRLCLERETVVGAWLTVVPYLLNGDTLSAEDFRDNLRIRFGLMPLDLRKTCDGCGEKLTVDHALQCNRGGLVTVFHNALAAEWGTLCTSDLTPSAVAYKPLINYGGRRTVTGRETSEADYEDLYRKEEAESE